MRAEQHADRLVVRAPAKVNLFLELLGKRPDGYHELVTLMAAVNLFDKLEFAEESAGGIVLECDDPAVPVGRENLVVRAAELIAQAGGIAPAVRIRLEKRIPMAAGLAGGSSDAAATLAGLNRFWKLGLSGAELADLAAKIGSDVPFFLVADAAWCTGRGEVVSPDRLPVPLDLVIACPPMGLATADVYRLANVPAVPRSGDPLRRALEGGEPAKIGPELFNRLQAPAEQLCPAVADLRRLFESLPVVGHALSGSGSACFALCESRDRAQAIASAVQAHDPRLRVFVGRTLSNDERSKDEGQMTNDERMTKLE